MSHQDTVTVRFIPQAWVNDHAIQVDPAGPTTFTVPAGDEPAAHQQRRPRSTTAIPNKPAALRVAGQRLKGRTRE